MPDLGIIEWMVVGLLAGAIHTILKQILDYAVVDPNCEISGLYRYRNHE